jgi:galactokinase
MRYFCYILQCADGTFYTGWTTDPSRRVKKHNMGTGARYTRMHTPVRIAYLEEVEGKSQALKRELQLKQLPHARKAKLIQTHQPDVLAALPGAEWLITAPGRVNLLGEHVDYNGGPVLPVAINRSIQAAVEKNSEEVHEIHALDLNEVVFFNNSSLQQKTDIHGNFLPAWAMYPAGVAWAAIQHSLPVSPIKAFFKGSIPVGAGLSSSAALEVVFALAWQAAGNWKIDKMAMAKLCLQAESEYVGLQCGLMDQFACLFGRAGHVMYFDTASLEWSMLPFPEDISLVIVDSGIRHTLTHSGYNLRQAECMEALKIIQQNVHPVPQNLAEVTPDQLQSIEAHLPDHLYRRAKHVVEECARVRQAKIDLQNGQISDFGRLMVEGHLSLRYLYEVSLPELDALVAIAEQIPGCLGARLTGAGFGGCTINLVRNDQLEAFIAAFSKECQEKTGKIPTIMVSTASDGASVLTLK